MTRAHKMFAQALIAVGLLAAIWVAVGRVVVEQTDRTVGMAVDWTEAVEIAAAEGVSATDVLVGLQSAGATHLAVGELSLGDRIERGEVALFSRGDVVEIWADDEQTLHQVGRGLRARFPGEYRKVETQEGETWLSVPAPAARMATAGAGYPSEALRAARGANLRLIARPRWEGVRMAAAAGDVLRLTSETGAGLVVFEGEQVVGFPRHVEETARWMQQLGLQFGLIELVPQFGASELAARLECRVVRVHSITEQEMRTISVDRAIDRFVRAARERRVRMLYMRMLPSAEGGLIAGNAAYLDAVRAKLRAEGMKIGTPAPQPSYTTPWWRLAIVQVGVIGAFLWLLQALFGLRGRSFWALAGLLLVGGAAAMFGAQGLTRLLAALAAAVLFPTIAVGYAARVETDPDRPPPGLSAALPAALGDFLVVSVITACGGLLVVGLLADTAFMVKVAQFRGVKLAHVLPIAAVALLWLARSTQAYRRTVSEDGAGTVDYHSGETVAEWPALWRGLRDAFSQVVAYWHVAAALVGLALLAMLMLRSGNQAEGVVLPMERELRAALDRLLVVRPRTKEVFLGHPLMILGLMLALRRARRGLWVAFAAGTIGQVSLLNSFCHLHTPLLLTLLRVVNGIWLGALAGIVLCTLWDLLGGAPPRPREPVTPPDEDVDEE